LLTHKIAYRDHDTSLTGTLVRNGRRSGPSAGVLVVHGGAGPDAHAVKQAHRFAEAGYVAFACDMYGADVVGNRERVLAAIEWLRSDRTRIAARAQPAVDILRAQPDVGSVAVVGYCFGGLVALELARHGLDLQAFVSVHGTLTTRQPADLRPIAAPVLVCQGAVDPHCRLEHVLTFAEEMKTAGADWELVLYGRAMHGFTHDDAKGQMPGVLYDADADARAFAAIGAFLRRTLGGPAGSAGPV